MPARAPADHTARSRFDNLSELLHAVWETQEPSPRRGLTFWSTLRCMYSDVSLPTGQYSTCVCCAPWSTRCLFSECASMCDVCCR